MNQKIDNLQVLRALAAGLVVISHSVGNFVTWKNLALPSQEEIWNIGKLGVAMFFVISGFVMMYIHQGDFKQPKASLRFYRKRISRIVPLYWLFTLIVALKMTLQGRQFGVFELIKSLFFIPYENTDHVWEPLHALGWTLNFEMYFYFIFGVCLLFNKRIGLALLFLSIILPVVMLTYFEFNLFYGNPIVLYFLAGIFIFLIKDVGLLKVKLSSTVFFYIAVSATVIVFIFHKTFSSYGLCLSVLLPLLGVNMTSPPPPPALATHFGNASYSLYLVHPLLIGLLLRLFKKLDLDASDTSFYIYITTCLLVTLMISHIIYNRLEKPLGRLLSSNIR